MSTPDKPARANDATINVTCMTCSSGRGWCNLRVTRLDGGDIVLDPYVLRHEALCCIPYRVGRDLEEYLWV